MKQAISGLISSKKAIVYVVTVGVMAGIIFGGVDPEQASGFVDKLTKLAMAYLGGQGLADLGKYAGEAYASGKKAIAGRDPDVSQWDERVEGASAAADDIADDVGRVVDKVEKDGALPAPPKTGN